MSDGEVGALRAFVERGGRLLCTGATGTLQEDGTARMESPRTQWADVAWIEDVPCDPKKAEVRPGVEVPVYPALADDAFGQEFLRQVAGLLGRDWLKTDAPWHVRVRAWLPAEEPALVLHWVNYRQDEDAEVEVPWPVGPLAVRCALPAGRAVERVEWLYPEMGDVVTLPHTEREERIEFTIPQLIVYGMSAIYLRRS